MEIITPVYQYFRTLQDKGVNLVHIESRPSKAGADDYEFYVDCDNTKGSLNHLIPELKERSNTFRILSRRRSKSSSAGRVKSGIFGHTAKFGQRACLFHISNIGIKIN